MAEMDVIARQLSSGVQKIRVFEQRYGTHALLRERQHLLRAFEPLQHIRSMLQFQNAARVAFSNPFEEMMRSIRPSLDDIRRRAGIDCNMIRSIQAATKNLSRHLTTCDSSARSKFWVILQ